MKKKLVFILIISVLIGQHYFLYKKNIKKIDKTTLEQFQKEGYQIFPITIPIKINGVTYQSVYGLAYKLDAHQELYTQGFLLLTEENEVIYEVKGLNTYISVFNEAGFIHINYYFYATATEFSYCDVFYDPLNNIPPRLLNFRVIWHGKGRTISVYKDERPDGDYIIVERFYPPPVYNKEIKWQEETKEIINFEVVGNDKILQVEAYDTVNNKNECIKIPFEDFTDIEVPRDYLVQFIEVGNRENDVNKKLFDQLVPNRMNRDEAEKILGQKGIFINQKDEFTSYGYMGEDALVLLWFNENNILYIAEYLDMGYYFNLDEYETK